MTQQWLTVLLIFGAGPMITGAAVPQGRSASSPFDTLRGEWQLPTFKDANREYTIRLHFDLEKETQVLKHTWTADGFSDRGSQRVGFATENEMPVLQFFDATGKARVSVPYELKDNVLKVDAALLIKEITRDTIRQRFKEKWEPLLKDSKEWQRVKLEK